MSQRKTHILLLENDDHKKELEFEIAFQLTLTTAQRYNRMKRMFRQNLNSGKKHGSKKTSTVISRS